MSTKKNTNFDSGFAGRLDGLMRVAKPRLTQSDVAGSIGVTQTTVNGWLAGRIPSGDLLYKLARAFNVSMEWLIAGEPEPPKECINCVRTKAALEDAETRLAKIHELSVRLKLRKPNT